MPRGGARPGAGRKPQSPQLRAIRGGRKEVDAETAQHVEAPPPDAGVCATPAYLIDPAAVAMWTELAPLALERRTLTAETRRALALLCEKFVTAGKLAAVELGGTAHARMLKQINTEMLQFGLTPNGKPMFAPKASDQPASALSKFRMVGK